jgi:molybdenum cofactor synthesis domain-containing protein
MTNTKKVTAGILLIGDELLSGRTQDTNLAEIVKFLAPLGVQVGEARILADDATIIREAVKSFSDRFDYVFTTGGIGPTHDDITADCIAAAFGLGISEREDALAELRKRYDETELNAARRRMARIPDGASLIDNPVSQAPGFQTKNVFTLAGVPQIMRGMLVDITHRIEGGDKVHQITVSASDIGEGDAAVGLAKIEAAHPGVSIGSYPWFNDELRGINFVASGTDVKLLEIVKQEIKSLVNKLSEE